LLKVTNNFPMTQAPLLLIGGAGVIGRQTAQLLRANYPEVPFLFGGRNLAKANAAAAEIGQAEGVLLDLTAPDLGLGQRPLSAVVIFYMDHTLAALRFAQGRGVPFLSISTGIFEIAPEIAAYMHQPHAAAIVLGYEWLRSHHCAGPGSSQSVWSGAGHYYWCAH
jgi:hypothetical protein